MNGLRRRAEGMPAATQITQAVQLLDGQRAALNVAPSIAPDGTSYTLGRAHLVSRYNYLITVNPDLTVKWASSLRDHLNDGCNDGSVSGSILPLNGQPGGWRVGAHPGVDPATNEPGLGRVPDDQSSAPTTAPHATILFGTYTRYNYAKGHLMQFSASGQFLHALTSGGTARPRSSRTAGRTRSSSRTTTIAG